MAPPSDTPLGDNALPPIGRRRFIVGAGAIAGASALTTAVPDGIAHAELPTGASKFVPLPKGVRLADTRFPTKYDYIKAGPTRIRVKIADANGVSKTASAVVVTVTAVNGANPNFVTVFPTAGAIPVVSNLNLSYPGETTANLATVKLGTGGSIDVYSLKDCDMIVDVLGYYEPVTGPVSGGRFIGLSTAQRAIDTRPHHAPSRSYTIVDVTSYVPTTASSVVINLTATETTAASFFTGLPINVPETSRPTTSSLNVSRAGDTRAAGVIVPVSTIGGRRRIKIYTLVAAKLIVDVVGYFTSESALQREVGLFVPVIPLRLIDTRKPGSETGKLWPRWVVEVKLPANVAANASAVVANVTGVESRGPGFLTVSAARQPLTTTSNLNFSGPGQVVPNHVITPVAVTHGLQVYSSHGAHVLVDLAGYFTGTAVTPRIARHVNPPPPAAPPEWTLRIPKLGLTSSVRSGDARHVTDTGHSWHWTGTGFMGQDGAHVAMFAHRTEAGGPYRYLDQLVNGDTFTITTGDRREFTYRMVRRDLTDAQNANILAATRFHSGTTVSLIACTVGHDRRKSRWPDVWAATSLRYRIVVTAELVSWREF